MCVSPFLLLLYYKMWLSVIIFVDDWGQIEKSQSRFINIILIAIENKSAPTLWLSQIHANSHPVISEFLCWIYIHIYVLYIVVCCIVWVVPVVYFLFLLCTEIILSLDLNSVNTVILHFCCCFWECGCEISNLSLYPIQTFIAAVSEDHSSFKMAENCALYPQFNCISTKAHTIFQMFAQNRSLPEDSFHRTLLTPLDRERKINSRIIMIHKQYNIIGALLRVEMKWERSSPSLRALVEWIDVSLNNIGMASCDRYQYTIISLSFSLPLTHRPYLHDERWQ